MTPPLFRERLARWLVDVTLEAMAVEAGEHGTSRPDEPGTTGGPAERPVDRNSGTTGPRSHAGRKPDNHRAA